MMAQHRDHHLKGTGKISCLFTGSRSNISLTASVVDTHKVTFAALGILKAELAELSANTAEKKSSIRLEHFTDSTTHQCWQKPERVTPASIPA